MIAAKVGQGEEIKRDVLEVVHHQQNPLQKDQREDLEAPQEENIEIDQGQSHQTLLHLGVEALVYLTMSSKTG